MRTAAPRTAASADAQTELTWLIYETLRNTRAWIEVLARLQRLMAAEAVVLGWHDVATAGGACVHQVGLDPALVDRYETEFSGKNPWMQAEQLFQARAIVAGEEILPSVDLMKTEFYQEYLRPQRLLHGLCGVVCRRGSEFWHLTAARRPSRPAFDEADRRELGRLLPHIERVLELGWELAGERSARHALLDVLDQLSTAIVMVDAEARPIMVNAAAEHMLGLGDGMMVHSRRLEALWHSERTRLMQLIAAACAPPNGGGAREGGHLKITRPSGMRPFLVIGQPSADGVLRWRRTAAAGRGRGDQGRPGRAAHLCGQPPRDRRALRADAGRREALGLDSGRFRAVRGGRAARRQPQHRPHSHEADLRQDRDPPAGGAGAPPRASDQPCHPER